MQQPAGPLTMIGKIIRQESRKSFTKNHSTLEFGRYALLGEGYMSITSETILFSAKRLTNAVTPPTGSGKPPMTMIYLPALTIV
ncbi:hypothetical protein P4056_12665, partial [Pseudomonas aeruginosa]|nr:hypothetical protein [Pseudomonas aeruginosa]